MSLSGEGLNVEIEILTREKEPYTYESFIKYANDIKWSFIPLSAVINSPVAGYGNIQSIYYSDNSLYVRFIGCEEDMTSFFANEEVYNAIDFDQVTEF